MPNADDYQLLNKTAILLLLTQINLHQVSSKSIKESECLHSLGFPTHRTLLLAEDDKTLWIEPKTQSPGQHTLLSYQLNRSMCAHKSFVWVWNIPPALAKQFPNTGASPMHTEQIIYLLAWSIYIRLWIKSQGNIRATAGRAQHTALHYHLSTEQEHQWQLLSCCSLCKNMQRPRDSASHTSRNAHTESSTSSPKLPSQLPAVPPAQRFKQQEASRTQILFLTSQLGEEYSLLAN